jgi:hypothetical protein
MRVEPRASNRHQSRGPAGVWVHQMRLGARKARHLDVSEVIVLGVISGPSLDVVARVRAAVEEGRHDLAVLIS